MNAETKLAKIEQLIHQMKSRFPEAHDRTSLARSEIDHSGRHIPRSGDGSRTRDSRGLLDDAAVVETTVAHATVAIGTHINHLQREAIVQRSKKT